MPVIPNFVERLLLLDLNQAPGVFLDLLGTASFQAVLAAARLQVFESLARRPMSAAELARELEADESGLEFLASALVSLGYLSVRKGVYRNTALTTKWLVRDSPDCLVEGLEFWGMLLFDFWSGLTSTIRDGRPGVDFYHDWLGAVPGRWEAFQAFMVTGQRAMSNEIVRRVRLRGSPRRLLDVGGGHGRYSVALCREYPQLSATIVDLPGALEVAREIVAAEGMADRVELVPLDIRHDRLGDGYDVALLFNVVHTFGPEQAQELVTRTAQALARGGELLVLEQLLEAVPGTFGRMFASVAALNFHHMVGGRGYTVSELSGLLEGAGLGSVRSVNLRSLPGNGIVAGVRERA